MKNSKRRATLMILGSFLSGACATTFISCQAEDLIAIWAFDVRNYRIYRGPKENPTDFHDFTDLKLEKMIAMSLSDWTYVRNKLATCKPTE